MKKNYSFRFEPSLIKSLDGFEGSRTYNLRCAIQLYCDGNAKRNTGCNTDYIQHLNAEVLYLRNQNNALLVSRMPLLSRVILKLKS